MEAFYLKVYLFRSNDRVPPIKIARNSQLPIIIELMDYTIPAASKASAFASGSSGKIYTQPCTVDGNRVIFTPQIGFFVPGRNSLQYLINDGVIPLAIDVYCDVSLPDGGEAVTPEEVLPYVTRAENAATQSEAAAARAEEVKNSIQEDYSELINGVNQLKDDLLNEKSERGISDNKILSELLATQMLISSIHSGYTIGTVVLGNENAVAY